MLFSKVKEFNTKSIQGNDLKMWFKVYKDNFSVGIYFNININGINYSETEIETIVNDGIDFSQLSKEEIKVFFKLLNKYLYSYNPYRVFWLWLNKNCILSNEFLDQIIKKYKKYNGLDYHRFQGGFWHHFNEYQLCRMDLSSEFIEKYIDFLDLKKLITSKNKNNISKDLYEKLNEQLNMKKKEKENKIREYSSKLEKINEKLDVPNNDDRKNIEYLKESIAEDVQQLTEEVSNLQFIIKSLIS